MTLFRTLAFAALALLALGTAPVAPAQATTLRWAAARDIGSLDPDSFGDTFTLAFLNHIYEGLVRYDENLKIEPALATSWEILEPTLWRFHLRAGVKFQDGASLTADDVIASLKRATDDTSPLKGNLSAFKDATKVDDLTLDMRLNSAYPLLLNDLTNIFIFSKPWLVANHAEAPTDVGKNIEGYATFHTNGTGPFKLVSRQADAATILAANPNWWDKPRHNIDRIEFQPITTDATRLAALISGAVDYTNAVPLQTVPRLQSSEGVKVLLSTELRAVFFALNFAEHPQDSATAPNPLRDLRVRQALDMAVDIEQLHRGVMRNLSRNTGALVAPAIPGYTPEQDVRAPYNIEAAKKLLAEAGYPNGFSLSLVCASDGYVNEEAICQAAAAMWAKIGVKVALNIGPRGVITQKRVAGQFDVTTLGWANEPAIDALSILVQVIHSKTGSAGVFNWGGWGRADIDRLTDDASNELDTAKRLAMMNQALMIAKNQMLFLPLHEQPMAWAMRDTVASVVQLSDNKARHWLTRMK
jgi:peptide/nickel transport system substrate-binding protein